jgi:uncharacterized lipoprotein YmbA
MKQSGYAMKAMLMLCLTTLALAACGTTPSVRYYTLSALPRLPSEERAVPELTVALVAVQIPDMLERPQIVTRRDENRVSISEFHRWAGSLRDDMTRVLMENLNNLLKADHVMVRTMDTALDPRYQLSVQVTQLEGRLGGTVKLDANWTISLRKTKEVLSSKDVLIEQPAESGDYDAYVSAQSRLIGVLSQEIAKQIRVLRKSSK